MWGNSRVQNGGKMIKNQKITNLDLWNYARTDTKIAVVFFPVGLILILVSALFSFGIGFLLGMLMFGFSGLHCIFTLDRRERPDNWEGFHDFDS